MCGFQTLWAEWLRVVLWFKELGRTCGFLCSVRVCSGYGQRAGGSVAAKPAACVVSASARSRSHVRHMNLKDLYRPVLVIGFKFNKMEKVTVL